MTVNPAGYVCPYDGGVPRIMTGMAWQTISGGALVFTSGAADAVSSGLNSLAASDIGVCEPASGLAFNGVALSTTASGGAVAFATQGCVVVRAGGNITSGYPVMAIGVDSVAQLAATSGENVAAVVLTAAGTKIGRALSEATSGNYVLIQLSP